MSSIFQKIFGEGSSFIFSSKKEESVLGIDIGSSSIKVVQLKKKAGKAVLETYGALALGPYAQTDVGASVNLQAESLTQALLDVLKESSTTTKKGALAIPSSASLIFLITLPGAISENDLSAIIPNEARKYIPVPISEVALDWWMIPSEVESTEEGDERNTTIRDTKTEVLTVAIHNDTLTKYRELLTVVDIDSNFFEMEVFSSVRSSLGHELAPVMLIDFGASKTKVSIVEHGIVRTFHIIPRGGQDITRAIATSMNTSFKQAEQIKREIGLDSNQNPDIARVVSVSVDYIFSEANSIALAYQKKYNKSISKVIFTGGGAMLRGLIEKGGSVFGAEVVYSNPFGKTEAPAFLAPILETSGPEFTVAVGLALRQLS